MKNNTSNVNLSRIQRNILFQKLSSDPVTMDMLAESSSVHNCNYQSWYDKRKFITYAITKANATFLDIGCANGLLAMSIEQWLAAERGIGIEVFGIDNQPHLIEEAKNIFSDKPDHFAMAALNPWLDLKVLGLPENYDYIYWNVWDNWWFDGEGNDRGLWPFAFLINHIKVGGRLVLGFYAFDQQTNLNRIATLTKLLKDQNIFLSTPQTADRGSEAVAWIDKKPPRPQTTKTELAES